MDNVCCCGHDIQARLRVRPPFVPGATGSSRPWSGYARQPLAGEPWPPPVRSNSGMMSANLCACAEAYGSWLARAALTQLVFQAREGGETRQPRTREFAPAAPQSFSL
jgi:hypothetical protein